MSAEGGYRRRDRLFIPTVWSDVFEQIAKMVRLWQVKEMVPEAGFPPQADKLLIPPVGCDVSDQTAMMVRFWRVEEMVPEAGFPPQADKLLIPPSLISNAWCIRECMVW